MWHPSNPGGREFADRLRAHFGRDLHQAVTAGRGVSVLERNAATPGMPTPLPVDWNEAEFTAVVALVDGTLVDDPEWARYVRDTAASTRARGLPAGFFAVTVDHRGLDLQIEQQALRWDTWDGPAAARLQRLTTDLTHEFCRLLRHGLEAASGAGGGEAALELYMQKVRVFISHSKHDDDGELVAHHIRDWFHAHSPLDSFFDVYDIPPGLPFGDVLLHQIGGGAVLAVHSDSYSSREWCRREVIEAKRRLVPMVVADCVRDVDPRSMAYLGNVPVVRMEPARPERIGIVASCLLDEVFRTWLWRCRVGSYRADAPEVLFTARPPELLTLAALPPCDEGVTPTIVYPEPLMSADEARLFSEVAPGVCVQTLPDWLEERP